MIWGREVYRIELPNPIIPSPCVVRQRSRFSNKEQYIYVQNEDKLDFTSTINWGPCCTYKSEQTRSRSQVRSYRFVCVFKKYINVNDKRDGPYQRKGERGRKWVNGDVDDGGGIRNRPIKIEREVLKFVRTGKGTSGRTGVGLNLSVGDPKI